MSVELRNYNIDIAAVTETPFKAKHSDNIVAIPDYTLLRRDGIGRRGGGVAVYVRSSFQAKIWEYSGDNCVFELLWITIDDLFVGVVYHPPKPSYDEESFLDYLETAVDEISSFISTADNPQLIYMYTTSCHAGQHRYNRIQTTSYNNSVNYIFRENSGNIKAAFRYFSLNADFFIKLKRQHYCYMQNLSLYVLSLQH